MFRLMLPLLLLPLLTSHCLAGTGYEVTSTDGKKTITYMVNFGGGKLFEQHTAFDPVTQKFVYLNWKRNGEAPQPVCSIWDHQTGRTIPLYKFPNVKNPLPVIPSIEAMKVCPITGDRKFKFTRKIAYD